MRNVQVLLRENVDNLGIIGDVVSVAPGYARNYLLPRKIAIAATPENTKMMERRRVRYLASVEAQAAEVEERIAAISRVRLTASEKADDTGTLYGSVSAQTVAGLLKDAGFEVEERAIRLEEPIKVVGEHEVPIHVHGEHYASVQLVVQAST